MKLRLNFSFNKVLMYSAAALLAVTSAYSIPKEPCDTVTVCCEKPQPGPYAFSYPKDVGLSCPRDFYVYGDFLLMKASEDGLNYAIEDSSVGSGSIGFPLSPGDIHGLSTQAHNWNWNMGARFGFGFYLNHDQWNIEGSWMYLKINNDKSSFAPGESLLPLWAPIPAGTAPTSLQRASERWTGTMNVFDLMLGKPFHVSRYFVFNPNFGLRAAWIDQDLLARYSWAGTNISSTSLVEMFGENEYWGVGIRGGFKAEFILGGGWDLFGAFNIAMLFSKFELDQDTSGYSDRTAGDYEFHNNYFTNVPNFDLTAGISYGHFFSKNKYMMSFKLAYEFQEWFQQNHFRRNYSDANITYNDEVPHGDLTLNGLSFRLQFDL